MINLDFETYSEAGYRLGKKVKGLGKQGKGGLPAVGTAAYAEHPSTDILSLAYSINGGEPRLWFPGMPPPSNLFDAIHSGMRLSAWNFTFEFFIWMWIAVRKYGWPAIALENGSCQMAASRRYSFPGSLSEAAKVAGTAEKDHDGKSVMLRLSRPLTPTKDRSGYQMTPANSWAQFLKLYAYNIQDVVAEMATGERIPPLSPQEQEIWFYDQMINIRGVQVDVEALDAALIVLEQTERAYTLALQDLTERAVMSVGEVENMKTWICDQGYVIDNLRAGTVKEALKDNLTDKVRDVLLIRQAIGSLNVKKLRMLKMQISRDGRLRCQYSYCGADRTGRWSSGGVQLQNLSNSGPVVSKCNSCGHYFGAMTKHPGCPVCNNLADFDDTVEWCPEAAEQAIDDFTANPSFTAMQERWGGVIKTLTGCIRGLFVAKPKHRLIIVDFSSIEAVVLACLSRCQWRIDVFKDHGKIYEMSAAAITGKTFEFYMDYKQKTGNHHPDRKKIGKVAELASGYAGWLPAWRQFGAEGEDWEIKQQILAWRAASPEIVQFWGGQYIWCGPDKWDYTPHLHGLEGMAIMAILNPGQIYTVGDIAFKMADDCLKMRLPSGRCLHYHRPRLSNGKDPLKRGPCYKITYEGWNSNPTKGPVGWHRMDTYGGRFAENATQAVARDIQADAVVRCEKAFYPVVMHTHDEIVAEVPEEFDDWRPMAALMTQRPVWANWWPIRAAGFSSYRYGKD